MCRAQDGLPSSVSSPGFFAYEFDHVRSTFRDRHGGLDVPALAARGPEYHFDTLIRLLSAPDSAWIPVDVSGKGVDTFFCDGGFVADFDAAVLVLYARSWIPELRLDEIDITAFEEHPHLRRHLGLALERYWPGWRVSCVDQESFLRCLTGRLTARDVQVDADLRDTPAIVALEGSRLQACYREYLEWELKTSRAIGRRYLSLLRGERWEDERDDE